MFDSKIHAAGDPPACSLVKRAPNYSAPLTSLMHGAAASIKPRYAARQSSAMRRAVKRLGGSIALPFILILRLNICEAASGAMVLPFFN
jgi:hypothetical protein